MLECKLVSLFGFAEWGTGRTGAKLKLRLVMRSAQRWPVERQGGEH